MSASPNPAPPSPRLPLGVIFLTLYLDLIGFSVLFPVAPAMLEFYVKQEEKGGFLANLVARLHELAAAAHAPDIAVGALFGGAIASLFALMQFIFSPIWGARSDRDGRRPVLLMTVAGNALSYVVLFFSRSFLVFLASRVIAGIMSGNLSVAVAAVADVTSRENRAKGMGLVGAAFGLGFLTGPLLGGLTAHIDLTAKIPGLAAWGVHPFSIPAAIAVALCLANLAWIWARFEETLPTASRGASHRGNPLKELFASRDPVIKRTNVVGFLVTFAFGFFETTISFFAADRLGWSPRQLTFIFVFAGVISILTQGVLVRRFIPRIGEKRAAIGGVTAIALALMGLGYAIGVARSPALMFCALALNSVGSGFANVGLSSLVSLYATPEEQGRVTGVFRSFGALARACSPAAAGILFFNAGGTPTFVTAGLLLFIPAVLAAKLPQPTK